MSIRARDNIQGFSILTTLGMGALILWGMEPLGTTIALGVGLGIGIPALLLSLGIGLYKASTSKKATTKPKATRIPRKTTDEISLLKKADLLDLVATSWTNPNCPIRSDLLRETMHVTTPNLSQSQRQKVLDCVLNDPVLISQSSNEAWARRDKAYLKAGVNPPPPRGEGAKRLNNGYNYEKKPVF